MRLLGILAATILLTACERVDLGKRRDLSLSDRALAINTVQRNAAASNAGDMETYEETFHPVLADREKAVATAQAMIEYSTPRLTISDMKTVRESPTLIILDFTRHEVSKLTKPGGSGARVRTTLMRNGEGWGIVGTQVVKTIR